MFYMKKKINICFLGKYDKKVKKNNRHSLKCYVGLWVGLRAIFYLFFIVILHLKIIINDSLQTNEF